MLGTPILDCYQNGTDTPISAFHRGLTCHRIINFLSNMPVFSVGSDIFGRRGGGGSQVFSIQSGQRSLRRCFSDDGSEQTQERDLFSSHTCIHVYAPIRRCQMHCMMGNLRSAGRQKLDKEVLRIVEPSASLITLFLSFFFLSLFLW